jgi:hypothetical protein
MGMNLFLISFFLQSFWKGRKISIAEKRQKKRERMPLLSQVEIA